MLPPAGDSGDPLARGSGRIQGHPRPAYHDRAGIRARSTAPVQCPQPVLARLWDGAGRGHPARMSAELTRRIVALATGLAVAFGTGPAVPAGPVPGGLPPAGQEPGEPADVATGYRWPLAGRPTVTREFDPPARRWLPGHRGVDLAGTPGAAVYAAGAGVVAFAGQVAGAGVVSIDHTGGLRTTYQPLAPAVAAGDRVAAGDPIGVLDPGHAGCPVPACLHWGLRQGQSYLDPLSLLRLGRLRLLPRA